MKIYYLSPPYTDLSIENEVLLGTGIELIPCSVHADDDVIRLGVGYEIIDVEGCRKRGILVCNVPDYGTEEVANHAHALCFAVHRRILSYDRNVRQGRWGYQLAWPVHRLSTLRVGVLGLGRIGSAFAKGIKPFVREVVAFDPFLRAEQFESKGIVQASVRDIFETSDIISLHLPLFPKRTITSFATRRSRR
jgi:D-3-phosphoglycerate dehydrogenase